MVKGLKDLGPKGQNAYKKNDLKDKRPADKRSKRQNAYGQKT